MPNKLANILATFEEILSPRTFKKAQSDHPHLRNYGLGSNHLGSKEFGNHTLHVKAAS